ncbi:MAG: hypothetical protein AB7T06_27005 [Kofleriaceae bacterium]
MIPFAFFGAGDASYFEDASLTVVFATPPSPSAKKKIEAGIPAPLERERWTKRTLFVANDDYALTGRKSFTAFNAAIETWLLAAHAIVPIDFALRAEDSEATTTFSQWHRDSMAMSVDLLAAFAKRYDDGETRAWAKSTLLDMMRGAGVAIARKLDPTPAWRTALDAGDAKTFGPSMWKHDVALQLALDPTNEAHRRAVLDSRPKLRESRIDTHILTIAIYDASPNGQHAIDQLLARAAKSPTFATLCATTACQCIEDAPACADTAFAVLDALVVLPTAHPIVVENALFAVEAIGAANVDRARVDRYCTLARSKVGEWKQLAPYLKRLGR